MTAAITAFDIVSWIVIGIHAAGGLMAMLCLWLATGPRE